MVFCGGVIFLFLGSGTTSVYSGFLGMKIATFANARTTLEARKRCRNLVL
ncbi:hypothetical protein GW17_00027919 [Ensete ventricosum]|nr:hypothetical protein GW17_00027919 [Ensete ventricosum]